MVSVGILHSLSGSMAASETALKDAALMAIDEINQQGGVLGKTITSFVEDGASSPRTFSAKAKKLIKRSGVSTLFGCWMSSCRKAVQPVVEEYNRLLWYPLQYEGLESSRNIFYTGLCLNQQVVPAVDWLVENVGKRFFLVGSDYIFPRTAHKVVTAQLSSLLGEICGDEYVSLDHQDFSRIIDQIQDCQPDVIVNTLNGASNFAFYEQYQAAGLDASQIPIMAMSVSEVEFQIIGAAAQGHYAAWSYFQQSQTSQNTAFVDSYQQRFGPEAVTSDPIVTAYSQVYLWKAAVEKAQSFESNRVRQAAYGLSWDSPAGTITLDLNHHTWKPCRIGQVLPNGQVKTLSESSPIAPQPWLGVDKQPFRHAPVITHILSEVSGWIQKAEELQITLDRLEQARCQRQLMEAQLRESQTALAQAKAELEISKRLQMMLLPNAQELAENDDLEIAGMMIPADKVGGDYYEVIQQGDRVFFGIGDVTGHGLESGVVMMIAQIAIRTLLEAQALDRSQLLATVNRLIHDNIQRMEMERHMTLLLAEYCQGEITIFGQHESLIIVRPDGSYEEIDTLELGFPLGIERDISYLLAERTLTLHPQDLLIFYTDGIPEAMNLADEQYGVSRLIDALIQYRHLSPHAIQQQVIHDVRQFVGQQKIFDDMTLMICRRHR